MDGKGCGPDEYEATVLAFLDRELASLRPVPAKTDQADELDAIVSDLLRQVMVESDGQPGDATAKPEDDVSDESPLHETPEKSVVTPFPKPKAAVAKSETEPAAATGGDAAKPENASVRHGKKPEKQKEAPVENRPVVWIKAPTFETVTASRDRRRTIIAVVVACFLVLVVIVAICRNF